VILSPAILTLLTLDFIFLLFGIVAFFLSFKIYQKWDLESTSNLQYTLEKQSYLTATIIKYIFLLKLPLFLFFIFTLDSLSNSINGAMCAAGVVDATPYGVYLFIFKIINIYLFGYWILLHYKDTKCKSHPFTKVKFLLFMIAFVFLGIEIILQLLMFLAIDPSKIVSCCGTLFSSTSSSYISAIFLLSPPWQLTIFYTLFVGVIISSILKNSHLTTLVNFLFLITAIITLISFFGTYIYELPTHHCPFCFLQSDYYYIGYFLYVFLFLGTFFGIGNTLFENSFQYNILFIILYTLVVSYYPISYYFENGVWL
jgi:hypothetical protein